MNRPIIGVTTSAKRHALMWWCTALAIRMAGGRVIELNESKPDRHKQCAGFIVSGGGDIDPSMYGDKNIASRDIEKNRDQVEKEVIEYALKGKKPILGICRGAQMINVVMGGTLHQNARDFTDDFIPNETLIGKLLCRRTVHIKKEGILSQLFEKRRKLFVNSIHHQAIFKLGQGLQKVAEDDLGITQGIEAHQSLKQFILGVQWHPEFMIYRSHQRKIFKLLVNACQTE